LIGVTADYIHVLDGRLRIKVCGIKHSPESARRLEQAVAALSGVTGATANPKSGNVLILYDSRRVTIAELVEAIRSLGHLQQRPTATSKSSVRRISPVARTLAQEVAVAACAGLIKIAFRSLVAALA
jgi:copper chaperone CopZ